MVAGRCFSGLLSNPSWTERIAALSIGAHAALWQLLIRLHMVLASCLRLYTGNFRAFGYPENTSQARCSRMFRQIRWRCKGSDPSPCDACRISVQTNSDRATWKTRPHVSFCILMCHRLHVEVPSAHVTVQHRS